MTGMKIRELIDMAIGFPEPGHVNFSALHCFLICIAEKLEITDEIVDFHNTEKYALRCCSNISNCELLKKSRLLGGYNPDEKNGNDTLPEPDEDNLKQSTSADVVLENDQADDPTEKLKYETIEAFIEPSSNTPDKEFIEQGPVIIIDSPRNSALRVAGNKMTVPNIAIPQGVSLGISVMKDQLEFAIEQMLLLTFLTLSKKPDYKQIQHLYSMAQTMIELKKENIYIESFKQIQFPPAPNLDWKSSGLQLNEDFSENDILEAKSSVDYTHVTKEFQTTHQDELDDHLCYSPPKLLDQFMELKGEFSGLINKVNELSSSFLQHESQRSLALIQEIQDQMQDIKLTTMNLKENQARVELKLNNNHSNIENAKKGIEQIFEEKVEKTYFEMQLANKVDYKQLQRKVSLDQFLELQCRIDKKFCDMLRQIKEYEKKSSDAAENLKTTLGFSAIDEVLKKFKENTNKDIQNLKESLNNYTTATNDDSAAAGSRVKVLQDLACLSCDTNCVMRTIEKAKVAKLPSAHVSNIISPLITYELGSIRKSGLMGYYRKDKFPHAPNAWLAQHSNVLIGLKQCIPRHAGGQHTTNSAKERIQRMSNRK